MATTKQQLLIVAAVALGIFLIVPCLLRAWTSPPSYPSIKPWPSGTTGQGPYRPQVDEWEWSFLNKWYGNSEDGVSGQQAWVWSPDNQLVTYGSAFPSWVPSWAIAFAWSGWRNNANNLKRPLRSDSLNVPVP